MLLIKDYFQYGDYFILIPQLNYNSLNLLFYLFLILKYFFLQLVSFCLLRQIAEIWRIIFLIPGTARLKPCLWPITDTKWATNVMINNFGTRPMTSANVSKNYISSIILSMMRITNIVTYFPLFFKLLPNKLRTSLFPCQLFLQ